jgi:cyclophilin family peptidyl-prolyl cis-trans isomerase
MYRARLFSSLAMMAVALMVTISAQGDDAPNPRVLIQTTDGDITIELFADKSPVTVENFLRYVDEGHYNGTVFHRVIPNFMIQAGGFTAALEEKPTRDPIVNESRNKLHNTRGTLAMARTSDPDSATAQFFINQRSNLRLDWTPGNEGYTVFGEVLEGMQVVDIIALSDTSQAQAMTTRGPSVFQDVPVKPIVINSMSRVTP